MLEAMLPYFGEHFGNAESAQHAYGWKAKLAIDQAREQVAHLINSTPAEILFTSGATESMNIAILGALEGLAPGRHVVSTNAEHKATLEICARARALGHELTLLPVDRFGQVDPAEVAAALRPNTALVTLLHANNEIGTLNDIGRLGPILRERGVLFHVDAAQTAGKETIDVRAMCIDLLSISAHKFYGPKGSGALFVRRPDVHLKPVIFGGGQERGLRGGTHNVPGIVGLGRACAIAAAEMTEESARLRTLRDRLIARLATDDNGIRLNGHPHARVCNNVHFSVRGIGADRLLAGLSDVAFSMASACAGGAESHVLRAVASAGAAGPGPAESVAALATTDPLVSSMRFGLGRFTTAVEVEQLIERVRAVIQNERAVSKSYDTAQPVVPRN